jgi:magnesium-transporting ATPase (P-type)
MATVHEARAENDGFVPSEDYVVHVKGAPDRIVKLCSHQAKAGIIGEEYTEPIDESYWIENIAILSSHGLRVIALCRGFVKKTTVACGDQLTPEFVSGRKEGPWMTLVGLCAIMDPPRPECINAIAVAHKAGIRVAMITGDHKDTVR